MTFSKSISTCFSKYVMFSGRASRSEYWWFILFGIILNIIADRLDGGGFRASVTGGGFSASTFSSGPISSLVSLALLLPTISVMVRRFHDIDKSGWWWLIIFVPFVGWIIYIVWMASKGTAGPNRFGTPPLDGTSGAPDGPDFPIDVNETTVEERDSPIPDVRNNREPTIRRR